MTLGVEDLDRSVRFYRDGMGLPLKGIYGTDADESTVAFFDLDGGLILALYPAPWLAQDAQLEPAAGRGAFTLGHNVTSKNEVDAVLEEASRAGASVPQPARDRVWGGYSGFFQDSGWTPVGSRVEPRSARSMTQKTAKTLGPPDAKV